MKGFTVTTIKVGFMSTNCYVLRSDATGNAVVIDPGADAVLIKSRMRELDARCILILLTHGHFDHILGVEDMRTTRAKIAIHSDDAHYLTERDSFSSMIPFDPRPFSPADLTFSAEGRYKAGEFSFGVLHTPGHTMGSVCYTFDDLMFTGDTLFRGSVGRSDFAGSDSTMLRASLKKLYNLPGDYVIYPGHDRTTLLSDERDTNPYMREFRV